MAELDDLTHAYLAAHPVDAARELERLAPAEAAALLAQDPVRLTAAVVEAMLPAAAAACVEGVAVERAALLVGTLRTSSAAGILRHLPESTVRALLEALPTAKAIACRALLRYPEDAVAALADTTAPCLAAGTRVDEALDLLRGHDAEATSGVYVVDGDLRLTGIVPIATLLRAGAQVRLQALQRPVAALPALMPLGAAAGHEGFSSANELAVVEHGGRFFGTLSAATLRRALAARRTPVMAHGMTLAGVLGEGYWIAVSSLSQALVAALSAGSRRPS